MMGPLDIEMAALKAIGDWLKVSGWSSALSKADTESSGAADSFLHAAHATKSRSAHAGKYKYFFKKLNIFWDSKHDNVSAIAFIDFH